MVDGSGPLVDGSDPWSMALGVEPLTLGGEPRAARPRLTQRAPRVPVSDHGSLSQAARCDHLRGPPSDERCHTESDRTTPRRSVRDLEKSSPGSPEWPSQSLPRRTVRARAGQRARGQELRATAANSRRGADVLEPTVGVTAKPACGRSRPVSRPHACAAANPTEVPAATTGSGAQLASAGTQFDAGCTAPAVEDNAPSSGDGGHVDVDVHHDRHESRFCRHQWWC
jgi:hypothetical protein